MASDKQSSSENNGLERFLEKESLPVCFLGISLRWPQCFLVFYDFLLQFAPEQNSESEKWYS